MELPGEAQEAEKNGTECPTSHDAPCSHAREPGARVVEPQGKRSTTETNASGAASGATRSEDAIVSRRE